MFCRIFALPPGVVPVFLNLDARLWLQRTNRALTTAFKQPGQVLP